MSSKKFLASSTPNHAILNSSSRVPEWRYDSLLENTVETVPVGDETYIIREKSETVVGSVTVDAKSTKSREGSNKTVTPQNEIEIQPEKIKKIRLSFNKPQSRLMNSSSLMAKEPSLPLDVDDQSDEDAPVSLEAKKSSSSFSSSSTAASLSLTVNKSNSIETQNVITENNSAFYDSSAVPGTKRKKCLRVVFVKSENSQSLSSKSVHKKVKLSNGVSSEEIVSNSFITDAVITTNGDLANENAEIVVNDCSINSNSLKNQKNKSNDIANETQTNGSTTFSLSNQLDSDSETPINRKSMSNSSANPTESFKKKLFSDYFEENSESSDGLKKFKEFNRKVWVKIENIDIANIPKPNTDTNEVEMKDEFESVKEKRTSRKSKSLLTKELENLKNLDSSKTSKKQYLTDWVEEQNSLLNESFEVELNRRFKAVSRSTQTSDYEMSEASSGTASYEVKAKRKRTKILAQESASKRKSERQQSARKNSTKQLDYKESSLSTDLNVRSRPRRNVKTTATESVNSVVTVTSTTKSTQEKKQKKTSVVAKKNTNDVAVKTDAKESDSDDIPLSKVSKKKSAKGKTKSTAATKKTKASEVSKKTTNVAAIAVSKEAEKIKTITISESESSSSEEVESVVNKKGRKVATRVLPRRNARNKETALANPKNPDIEPRKTRAKSGAATTRVTKK